MKQSQRPVEILALFINTTSREEFRRKIELYYPQLDNFQFEVLSEQLQQYQSFCKQRETLFLFPYILNNIRFINPELKQKRMVELLWKRGFENDVESIEKLDKMYNNWVAFEKKLTEVEKEHSINKELEQ